jgi:hypothetical protein
MYIDINQCSLVAQSICSSRTGKFPNLVAGRMLATPGINDFFLGYLTAHFNYISLQSLMLGQLRVVDWETVQEAGDAV